MLLFTRILNILQSSKDGRGFFFLSQDIRKTISRNLNRYVPFIYLSAPNYEEWGRQTKWNTVNEWKLRNGALLVGTYLNDFCVVYFHSFALTFIYFTNEKQKEGHNKTRSRVRFKKRLRFSLQNPSGNSMRSTAESVGALRLHPSLAPLLRPGGGRWCIILQFPRQFYLLVRIL